MRNTCVLISGYKDDDVAFKHSPFNVQTSVSLSYSAAEHPVLVMQVLTHWMLLCAIDVPKTGPTYPYPICPHA